MEPSNPTVGMWITAKNPALVLAPMEGVTDAPMRALLTETGHFTYCVSEFLRISHEIPPAKVYFRHIPELKGGCQTPSGTPIQIQLLGGHPERMAKSAFKAWSHGANAIDINFGCPAPIVNRHDGGAMLLKHPDRIREIVSAVRSELPPEIPVSAKLRLGWECTQDIFRNAKEAEAGGASWITIHARTKSQGYQPPVDWKTIGEVRRELGMPVVANGDIWSREDFLRCRDVTGAEHFMLGRGAVANPRLAEEISCELGLNNANSSAETSWGVLIRKFIRNTEGYSGHYNLLGRIKQWLRMAHFRHEIAEFELLKRAVSVDEILDLLPVAPLIEIR